MLKTFQLEKMLINTSLVLRLCPKDYLCIATCHLSKGDQTHACVSAWGRRGRRIAGKGNN